MENLKNKNIRTVNKQRLKEMEEKKRKEYEYKIMNHLSELEKRRAEVLEKNAMKIKAILKKEERNYERFLANKNGLNMEHDDYKGLLLERQGRLIERANLKDSTVYLNKLNA